MTMDTDQQVAIQEEQESYLFGGAEQKYFRVKFFNGENALVDKDGTAKGFWYDTTRMDQTLLTIFQTLEEEGKATSATIQHTPTERDPIGQKVYYTITKPQFYILSHGIATFDVMSKDITKRGGLVAGTKTVLKEDRKPVKVQTGGVTEVLALEKTLFDAGYLDETGMPRLICLHTEGLQGKELWVALLAHFELLKMARDKWKFAPSELQYYAYRQEIGATPTKHRHGSEPNIRMVYEIETKHPSKDKWTPEYLRGLRCEQEVFDLLRPLMRMTEPRGEVIEWCNERVNWYIDNQKDFVSPSGEKFQYGTVDAPPWVLMRQELRDDVLKREGSGQQQEQRAGASNPIEELTGQIDAALRFFIGKIKELAPGSPNADEKIHAIAVQGKGLCEQALILSNNEDGLSPKQLEKDLLQKFTFIGKLRTQVANSVPF